MRYTARVIPGQRRGKALGYPTFNLKIPPHLSTKPGIYAGYVWLSRRKYLGAFHYGPIPVFSDPTPHLEVFVIDFSSNNPVTEITFELLHYLRPIKNFSSPEALTHQISRDVQKTTELLS